MKATEPTAEKPTPKEESKGILPPEEGKALSAQPAQAQPAVQMPIPAANNRSVSQLLHTIMTSKKSNIKLAIPCSQKCTALWQYSS